MQPGDVEALAHALDGLLANDQLAETFAEASYQHAANFSWEAAAETLVEKINMLLDHDRLQSSPPPRQAEPGFAQQPAPMAREMANTSQMTKGQRIKTSQITDNL